MRRRGRLGVPVSAEGLPALLEWALPFGSEAVQRARESASDAWWIPLDDALSRFRLTPGACLAALARSIDDARAAGMGRIIWSLENRDGHGLDDFEAAAVLGMHASVDCLWQARAGDASVRMLALGRLRRRRTAYLFEVSAASGPAAIFLNLVRLRARGVKPVVLVSAEIAGSGRRAAALRSAFRVAWLSGALIPALRSNAADLSELRRELARVRASGLGGIELIRLLPGFAWDLVAGEVLHTNGFRGGVSFSQPAYAGVDDESPRAAYPRGGSFLTSSFDHRIPAAVGGGGDWLEIVSERLEWYPNPGLVPKRIERQAARLELLLDFKRMERYLADMPLSVQLQQRYHEYRVYNWPAADPDCTVELIEAGDLGDRDAVDRVLLHVRTSAQQTVPSGRELLQVATAEATERARTIKSVIAEQRRDHVYLEAVASAPLRSDIEEFAHFLPSSLGAALELGCGHGQLASALLPRSAKYVLLDLAPDMLRGGPSSLRVGADIHALPFGDALFDSIIANNVLEHSYDPVKCLCEVRRVLRPAGALLAFIPMDKLNPNHALPTHLWKADRESVRRACHAAGLTIAREELVDLYKLGVAGAFPQCNGLVLAVEARPTVS